MPQLRAPDGSISYFSDAEAAQALASGNGYSIASAADVTADLDTRAAEARAKERGALGTVNAALSGVASGATLGVSDVVLKGLLSEGEMDRLSAERKEHSIASTGGQLVGMLAPALATGGSALARTPAGLVSSYAARGANLAREAGGVSGVLGAAAATGAEAALQNAGMYVSDVALGDRDLTAEGLAGALGTGFAFGGATSAGLYGLERGSIAARRMFARTAEGGEKALGDAATSFQRTSDTMLQAHEDVAAQARARLQQLDDAVAEQRSIRTRADAEMAKSKLDAFAEQRAPKPLPDDVPPMGESSIPTVANTPPATSLKGKIPSTIGDVAEDEVMTIRAGDLEDRGYYEPPGTGQDAGKMAGGRRTIAEGQRDPITATVDPQGRIHIDDGRHRLAAALEGDGNQAIKIRFRRGVNSTGGGAMPRGTAIADDLERRAASATDDAVADIDAKVAADVAPPPAAKAEATGPDRVEVVSSGGYKPTIEVHTFRAGSATPEIRVIAKDGSGRIVADELDAAIESALPTGFKTGISMDARKGGASIERGIPEHAAIKKNSLYVVRPSELADHGIMGNELNPENVASIRSAWAEGKRLAPVDIDVLPSGKLFIEDGNHRAFAAAAAGDNEIVVNFRARGDDFRPQARARDVSDRLRPPPGASAPHVAATPAIAAPMSLEEQLAATVQRMEGGESFARVSADGQKAAQIAADQEHLASVLGRYDTMKAQMSDWMRTPGAVAADEAAGVEAQIAKAAESTGGDAESITDSIIENARAKAGRASHVDEIAQGAKIVDDYERAATELTEALGADASPAAQQAAQAYREAETAVDQAHLDRTAQAIDDHAEYGPFGPEQGPVKRGPRERFADAKQAKLEADAELGRLQTETGEVKRTLKGARAEIAKTKAANANAAKATETIGLPKPGASTGKSVDKLDIATALEAVGTIGIPGVPKPSDIPVIGPLLGAWLKFRALKAIAGRMTGRVAATGEARAASLAAKTKDRAAAAVDRMLGVVERKAASAARPITTTTTAITHALTQRIFDDGEKTPEKASPEQLAAARIRELAAAVNNPDRVRAEIRAQMRDVTDPRLITAAQEFVVRRNQYLHDQMPKAPPPSPFSKREWVPSAAAARSAGIRLAVAADPVIALEQVEQQCITPEAAQTLRAVYPKLFAQVQTRLVDRAADLQAAVPYQQQVRMSLLFDVPLDRSLEPATIASLQTAYASSPAAQTQQPTSPPTPSVASAPQLSSLFETAADRRAARR